MGGMTAVAGGVATKAAEVGRTAVAAGRTIAAIAGVAMITAHRSPSGWGFDGLVSGIGRPDHVRPGQAMMSCQGRGRAYECLCRGDGGTGAELWRGCGGVSQVLRYLI